MAGKTTMVKNAKGEAVRRLQQALTSMGFDTGPIDGMFGRRTEAGVSAFQKAAGLPVDGVVEPKTWEAIIHPSSAGTADLLLYRDEENPYRRHLLTNCIPPRPASGKEGKQ
jgi:peptidoglycan hydrolase-like protein with peptidoglycan-binding domain